MRWAWSHVAMSYKGQLATHMNQWVVYYVKVYMSCVVLIRIVVSGLMCLVSHANQLMGSHMICPVVYMVLIHVMH